jgi:class 3 adenylate cyclase
MRGRTQGHPVAEPTDVQRRLVAVFAADVEGYSRLMGTDEVGTLKALTERRAILDKTIADHRGRIANTAGDSVLAEFGSAVDAVQCAVEAQAALSEANASLTPDKRINFRIGIHVGDVMVRAGDLFGDGVNIAARLQTLAQPGGICVSGATYEQVRKIQSFGFVDLGVQRVKNIEEPVKAYSVRTSGSETNTKTLFEGTIELLRALTSAIRNPNAILDARRGYFLISSLVVFLVAATVLTVLSESFRSIAVLGWQKATRRAEYAAEGLWSGRRGEWVLFGVDNGKPPVAHFYRPDSLKSFDQQIAYTSRFPLRPGTDASFDNGEAYEDDVIVIDCGKSTLIVSERTIYSKSGKTLYHFKRDDPQSIDLTTGQPIRPGTLAALAQPLFCEARIKSPITQLSKLKLSVLASSPDGDVDVFQAGPPKSISDPPFLIEQLVLLRLKKSRSLAEGALAGISVEYRSSAVKVQIDCAARQQRILRTEYYDEDGVMIGVRPTSLDLPTLAPDTAARRELLGVVCGPSSTPQVAGNYEGMIRSEYKKGGTSEQKIFVSVVQEGTGITVTFRSGSGGAGKGQGTLSGSRVNSITLQGTNPRCPGSYEAQFEFSNEEVNLSYSGEDCSGPVQGLGNAKRIKG